MARKYRSPWYVSSQWCVEANTDRVSRTNRYPAEHKPKGWQPIYCTRSKAQARKDAKKWRAETGQDTRVVPGPGHKSRRGF